MQLELYTGSSAAVNLFILQLVGRPIEVHTCTHICDLESAQYFTGSDREEIFHVNILLYAFVDI